MHNLRRNFVQRSNTPPDQLPVNESIVNECYTYLKSSNVAIQQKPLDSYSSIVNTYKEVYSGIFSVTIGNSLPLYNVFKNIYTLLTRFQFQKGFIFTKDRVDRIHIITELFVLQMRT